ncbi:MAG: YfiR family protein [Thermoanaerobaculia bacterium]|nr:YfiR family protein [Thermoanaerobaculia bacterium]
MEARLPRVIVHVLIGLLLVGLSVPAAPAARGEAPPEYALKAEFLERFTRFVDWPRSAVERETFRIGIVGEDPFGVYLRKLADSRRIKNRRIEIHRIDEVEDVTECQLVFISDLDRSDLDQVLEAARERPILTIGDTAGYAEAGVMINFYLDGDRIRFEINENAVSDSGLEVDTRLLKLARVIERGQP